MQTKKKSHYLLIATWDCPTRCRC